MSRESWRFSPAEIASSPSVLGGWPPASEQHYRSLAIKRTIALKDLLACPQIVVSAAAVYVHRFFMRETMQEYDHAILAGAAFFLASKVEENPRRLRDIVGVTNDLNALRTPVPLPTGRYTYDETTKEFIAMRKKILFYEEVLLTTLAFDLTVAHPYAAMLRAASLAWAGREELRTDVARRAWLFINDSLITTACITQSPGAIAAASLYLASSQLEIRLPTDPSQADELAHAITPEEGEESEPGMYWMDYLKVTPEELRETVAIFLRPYANAKDEYIGTEASELSLPPIIPPPIRILAPLVEESPQEPLVKIEKLVEVEKKVEPIAIKVEKGITPHEPATTKLEKGLEVSRETTTAIKLEKPTTLSAEVEMTVKEEKTTVNVEKTIAADVVMQEV